MDPTLLLLLACGYAVGLLVWPWRRYMGGGRPGDVMDGRFAWAFMFSMLWPFVLIALGAEIVDRVRRHRRHR